jgi:type I restriction enzyme S subunit
LAGGTTFPNLTRDAIKDFSISYPQRAEVRHRIADVLAAYDDLIENNRRRMALLEDAARQLYEEWFVRLRFPGREYVQVVDGVPAGWTHASITDLCDSVDYGYTASAERESVGPKFLRITDIVPDVVDWDAVPYCRMDEDKLARFQVLEGDVVVARTGATVGYAKRLHKRHPTTVFASYLVRFRPGPQLQSLILGIYMESDHFKAYVKSRVGGAAQPNANARVLGAAQLLVPPVPLQRAFCEIVESMADEGEVLQVQNSRLRAARDLLLPRLMSGELAV